MTVIIPFRDRGRDPLRTANLNRVLEHWTGWDIRVVSDDRDGDEQFNRHRAYNIGASETDSDVLVYAEADMLIDLDRITAAVKMARQQPGLVVPFTERHELNAEDSQRVRAHEIEPEQCVAGVVKPKPRRIGAINVISRHTLSLVGQWDEQFEGNWWDDRSMHIAFDLCAGPTRWIDGPAYHLWHLPGHTGTHLTPEDKAATLRNRRRFDRYSRARTPDQIRRLTTAQLH